MTLPTENKGQTLGDLQNALTGNEADTLFQDFRNRVFALSKQEASPQVFEQLALLWTEATIFGFVSEEMAIKHIEFDWKRADKMREEGLG